MIHNRLSDLIGSAIEACRREGILPGEAEAKVEISVPKQAGHGDFSTNAALVLAAAAKMKPRDLAARLMERLPEETARLARCEIAGPGFINFTVKPSFFLEGLAVISGAGPAFGTIDIGRGKKAQVEFVSANPTGPLHIGHGRGAVYGDVLANVLAAAGYEVTKEYYVNDAGGQIRTLGRSVYLRLRELGGERIEFPEECYQGHYIVEIAKVIGEEHGARLANMGEQEAIEFLGEEAGDRILEWIKKDLADTGVVHDVYFFENRLHTDAMIEGALRWLGRKGRTYEKDGALWFRSIEYGDDKDRVLRKGDGALTYFAADIAYHKNKYDRGFDRVIDVWGADHAGYVARMKAAVRALGHDPASFDAVLIQLVNLIRAGELISMSTRSATYETLEDVRREVGRDVCRYFFLMRSHNAQLDFDLDLAKRESSDNPVYYIQYAHARIASIFRKAEEKGLCAAGPEDVNLSLLDLPEEPKLARFAEALPTVIEECALELEPHKLAFYLLELARMFQSYYSKGRADERYRVLTDDPARSAAKLYLLKNVRIVLQNALRILGISAPEEMARAVEEQDV
ncbi:MAG: arginine--tRNA ligase [Proteobacteria bacterium]|nr:arginine--tRNA ligase [Pseudomonadota bacterium]